MGFAIPAAVAASLAAPGRPVVALVGDGGAGMSIAELETAVRNGVHPVVLVFDNQRYGTIHDHQVQRGLTPVATDLGPVDWVRVGEGYGAAGARVDRDDAFEPALRAALAASRPTVLHLVVDRRWISVDRIGDAVSEADAGPDFESWPGAAPELETEPISEPEPGWEAEAEPALEPEPATEAEAESAAEPEPVAMAELEASPEAESATEPEPEPGPVAMAEPEASPEAESATEPEPGIPEAP
jgi:hypothetical protein